MVNVASEFIGQLWVSIYGPLLHAHTNHTFLCVSLPTAF